MTKSLMGLCVLWAAFTLAFVCPAQEPAGPQSKQEQAMTNADVLKMVEAKLSDALIIDKIHASTCGFDTSTDTILKLKSQGVSDGVIEAMVSCGKELSPTSAGRPADPNDPLSPHAPGIYWSTKTEKGQRLARLEASSYSGSHSSGVLGAGLSMGFKKAKWKATLPGAQATLRIHSASPEFWFYFEDASAGFGHSGLAAQASKPEDFALARMEERKDERQLVVGQASALGNSSGLRAKDIVPVNVQKVSQGIYKVTLSKPLERGEYCFVPPGGAAAFGMAGGQLYDFGIDQP